MYYSILYYVTLNIIPLDKQGRWQLFARCSTYVFRSKKLSPKGFFFFFFDQVYLVKTYFKLRSSSSLIMSEIR